MQRPGATAVARATDGASERPRLALAPLPLPRRPRITRRRVLGAVVMVAVLAGNAFVGRDVLATHHAQRAVVAQEAAADQQSTRQRATLTRLRADIAQITHRIEQSATTRDRANAATRRVNATAESTRTRATSTIATADADRARTALLHACLTVLHSAMNALAVDDQTSGANELRMLESECTAPNP